MNSSGDTVPTVCRGEGLAHRYVVGRLERTGGASFAGSSVITEVWKERRGEGGDGGL